MWSLPTESQIGELIVTFRSISSKNQNYLITIGY